MIIPREVSGLQICRAVYRVDRTATQKVELAIFLYISWVSASSVTSRCIFNTTSKYVVHYHVLFMKGWCLYSSSVKQCLLSVNRDHFLRKLKENGKHKTTLHSTSGWESSLGKIYHWNPTAARTGTWNPAQATKKTSSYKYIEWPLSPRVNKRGNKAKCPWNTRLS